MLALLRARSPILGSFALSVFRDAALFRVKRVRGEIGVGGSVCSEGTWVRDPRRLEPVEMLAGDRGAFRFGWRASMVAEIMIPWYSGGSRWEKAPRYWIWVGGGRRMKPEKGMNSPLVEEILCMRCPLRNRKTMILHRQASTALKSWLGHYCRHSAFVVSGEPSGDADSQADSLCRRCPFAGAVTRCY